MGRLFREHEFALRGRGAARRAHRDGRKHRDGEAPAFAGTFRDAALGSRCGTTTTAALTERAVQFTFESPCIRLIDEAREYAAPLVPGGPAVPGSRVDLTAGSWREFKYDPTATCVNTPTEEIFRVRRGSARTCPPRNYLPADGAGDPLCERLSDDGPPAGSAEAGGGRRLARLGFRYSPQQGAWFDLDPTNNQMPSSVTSPWPGAAITATSARS